MTRERSRSLRRAAWVVALLLPVFAGLVALGVWQLQRRAWKLDLIEQVDARLAAAPVPAPGEAHWSRIDTDDAYLRVVASGRLLHARTQFAQAVTERGAGFWVMTPLVTDAGTHLWINRGFVPPERRASGDFEQPQGPVRISGLLRLSEPGGGFLRDNQPAQARWYSRDTRAMSGAAHLSGPVAPYFIDADAGDAPWPAGGMTVVRFRNSHLVYALTWFTLAGMTLVAAVIVLRHARRR